MIFKGGFHTPDKDRHVSLSRKGAQSGHNPSKPKHKRCHEFSSASASAAARKRWAKKDDNEEKNKCQL